MRHEIVLQDPAAGAHFFHSRSDGNNVTLTGITVSKFCTFGQAVCVWSIPTTVKQWPQGNLH